MVCDFLIVGSGLFGATVSYVLKSRDINAWL